MFNAITLLGASEFWMTKWLTPIWLFGNGLLLGLAVLAVVILLLTILSKIPIFEALRRQGLMAHAIAGIGTIAVGAFFAYLVRPLYFSAAANQLVSDEWTLVSIAIFVITGIVFWTLMFCSSSRLVGELKSILFQGIGGYILGLVFIYGLTGLACTLVVETPADVLMNVPKLFSTGEQSVTVTVPGVAADAVETPFVPIELSYDPLLLESVRIVSDKNVVIADAASISEFRMNPVRLEANEEVSWNRKQSTAPPIPAAVGSQVHIQNKEIDTAKVSFVLRTLPPVPQVRVILITAFAVVIVGLLFLLQQGLAPKASAIALATAKSEVAQPLFLLLNVIGLLFVVLFVFLPFHTFGEDIKLLKDCGITVILVLSLFQGIWSASSSVSEEIEGRTALTVLSKPVGRRSFIIGKMLGVFWMLILMYLFLGGAELLAVAYKPLYDARETSQELPLWQICHLEMIRTIPGLAMALLHSVTLSAFSVAIATRLPQLANFAVCFSIYAIGHLTESLVSSAEGVSLSCSSSVN